MLRKHRLAGPLAAGRGSGHMVSSQRRKSSFASLAWSRQVPVEVTRHLLLRLEEFGHAQDCPVYRQACCAQLCEQCCLAQLCLIVSASRAGASCMQLRHGQDHHAQGQHHQRTRAEACSALRMGNSLCSAWFGKPFRKLQESNHVRSRFIIYSQPNLGAYEGLHIFVYKHNLDLAAPAVWAPRNRALMTSPRWRQQAQKELERHKKGHTPTQQIYDYEIKTVQR